MKWPIVAGVGVAAVALLLWWSWPSEPPAPSPSVELPAADRIDLARYLVPEGEAGRLDADTRAALATLAAWSADAVQADWPSALKVLSVERTDADHRTIRAAFVKVVRVRAARVVGSDELLVEIERTDGSRRRCVRLGPKDSVAYRVPDEVATAFAGLPSLSGVWWLGTGRTLLDVLDVEGGAAKVGQDEVKSSPGRIEFRAAIQGRTFAVRLVRADGWRLDRIEVPRAP